MPESYVALLLEHFQTDRLPPKQKEAAQPFADLAQMIGNCVVQSEMERTFILMRLAKLQKDFLKTFMIMKECE